jgi:hypothetical protein
MSPQIHKLLIDYWNSSCNGGSSIIDDGRGEKVYA